MASQKRMSLRLDPEFNRRLEEVGKKIGMDPAVIGKACLEALVKHVEEHGSITLPVEIASPKKSEAGGTASGSRLTYVRPRAGERAVLLAAEEPPKPRATKPAKH